MIKRRFYRNDHGDGDNASDSSSSSDSELDAEAAEETEAEDDVAVVREYHKASSSSFGLFILTSCSCCLLSCFSCFVAGGCHGLVFLNPIVMAL